MTVKRSLEQSKIFQNFKEIESGEYHSIIRFYEEYRQQINTLEFDEYFELLIAYNESLFEIGAYQSYLANCEKALEETILNNIKFYKGVDIFQELLFRKAASHYHLLQYDQSEHILRELIKIDPYNDISIRFLRKCLGRRYPRFVKNTRAVSVFFFMLAALIIAIEILFVRHFMELYLPFVEGARNVLFGAGLLFLIGGEVFNYGRIAAGVNRFAKKVRQDKYKSLS
ncbi:MAG: hypothetical protein AAFP19_06040 [Bacteroidota bacterium]